MKAEVSRVVYAIRTEDFDNDITQRVAISDEFDSVRELRAEMKERGYSRNEYLVIYSYELWVKEVHFGTGRGITDEEARKDLETSVNLGSAATVAMIKRNPEKYYW